MNGQWLLSDFHIHTQFSDGSLGLNEVVNLYGSNAFGAISITDHILDQQAFEICLQNEQNPMSISKTDFNYIANSDFHEKRHLYSWKTIVGWDKNVEAVKQALRKNDAVSIYLFREGKIL